MTMTMITPPEQGGSHDARVTVEGCRRSVAGSRWDSRRRYRRARPCVRPCSATASAFRVPSWRAPRSILDKMFGAVRARSPGTLGGRHVPARWSPITLTSSDPTSMPERDTGGVLRYSATVDVRPVIALADVGGLGAASLVRRAGKGGVSEQPPRSRWRSS
jgi:hypothetical protein